MDNYLKLLVTTLLWSHISTGRTYRAHYGKPHDSHGQFHHSFEHYDQDRWHNGAPEWDPPPYHRIHINNAQKRHPIVHRNDYQESKEYWRQHHPVSYKYRSEMYINYPGTIHTFSSHPVKTFPPITPSSPFSYLQCMQSCPATIEYSPVCGTNNVTYINLSRMECAKRCGIQVELQLMSRCPSTYTLQVERVQLETTASPIHTDLPENKEEYWTDILLTEPAFYYMDHSETTEKHMFNVDYSNPTQTMSTESATSKPGYLHEHENLADIDYMQYSQSPTTFLPDVIPDATDEDENFDIDVRNQPFDDM